MLSLYLDKFSKDASDGPNIDLGSVLSIADQKFRGSVPPGRHVVGKVVARS